MTDCDDDVAPASATCVESGDRASLSTCASVGLCDGAGATHCRDGIGGPAANHRGTGPENACDADCWSTPTRGSGCLGLHVLVEIGGDVAVVKNVCALRHDRVQLTVIHHV